MLVFAAFVPHPLISIPEVSSGTGARIRQTTRSYRELATELYAAQPTVVIVVSGHAEAAIHGCTINQQPRLEVSFAKFGNISDRCSYQNELGMGYRIKESLETRLPIFLTEESPLDYGSGIALFHLLRHIKSERVRVIPVGTSPAVTLEQHHQLGTALQKFIHTSTERVAVVATGDLSHGASRGSVAGYSPEAVAFNKRVKKIIEDTNVRELLSLSAGDLAAVHECAVRPLSVLYGILAHMRYTTRITSYEVALGVGYLSASFAVR